jgi:imidazolonepropionase-like amidohydrolase
MVVSLGQTGSDLAGGSRAAAMSLLREAIEDARDYANNKDSVARGNRRAYSLSRHDLEALVAVVQRRQPLLVRVERAADIERVLEFAKSQKITVILSGASEGWRVARKIAMAKVPVIVDPINNLPSSYETLGSRLDNALLLHQAGVKLMFTGMGWQNTHNAYLVRQSAGNAVANGLPYNVAIQAITSNPAQIFGLPGYGQIKVGAEATLVLWSGDPLEVMSNPDLVLIDGQEQSLQSRATRLRDRYYRWATE